MQRVESIRNNTLFFEFKDDITDLFHEALYDESVSQNNSLGRYAPNCLPEEQAGQLDGQAAGLYRREELVDARAVVDQEGEGRSKL